MTARERRRPLLDALRLAPAIGLGALPVAQLVATALAAPAGDTAAWQLDDRTLALLGRSLAIAAGAALGALVLGALIGIPLARLRLAGRSALAMLLLAAFAVSPYGVALGWLRGDLGSAAAQLWIGSPAAVAAVLATAYAPAVALLVLLAMRSVPVGWEEAGLVAAPWPRVLFRILAPRLAPLLAAAALLVFTLCLSDYAVASLLQVPTYPVEVFLLYAGAFDPGQAARACLPLVATALITAGVLGAMLGRGLARQWPAAVAGTWPLVRRQRIAFATVALAAFATCAVWPAAGLFSRIEPGPRMLEALGSGLPSLGHSLATTATAVALTLVLGLAASGTVMRARPAVRSVLAALLLLPLCLPGSAFAIAWIALVGTGAPTLRDALAPFPALLPALCLAGRWAGPVALLVAGVRLALPTSALDAARIQDGSAARRLARIELPLVAPVLLAAAAVVAALAHGATDVLVLTAPPGFEMAPLRIDNLLHYGDRADAAALAVASAALAGAVPLTLAALARRAWRHTT